MCRLLDWHTKILAYPFEARFCPGNTIDTEYSRTAYEYLENNGRLDLFARIIKGEKKIKDGSRMNYDIREFAELLRRKTPGIDGINSVSDAFFEATKYPQAANKDVIAWHASNGHLDIEPILEKFPDARAVYLDRNWMDAALSDLKRLGIKATRKVMRKEHKKYESNIQIAKELERSHQEQFKIFGYEKLVTKTQDAIAELLEFLLIAMENILLKPTMAGKPWAGNSSYRSYSGISSRPVRSNTINKIIYSGITP